MSSEDKIPRLSRLTAILLKLQSQPVVDVKDLAAHFEVSTRTIYRDMGALEEAGVPLASEEGGGYTLVEGYNMPPVMFTESEANALIIAEKIISKSKDASLIHEFSKAVEKIKSVLHHGDQEKANFLSERIIIGNNWDNTRTSSYLSEIQRALTHLNVLQLHYRKQDAEEDSVRKVEPFALYHNTSDNWILIAWCRLREDFRSFRVDRIQRMHILGETFPRHEMSLDEYIARQEERLFGG